MKYIKKTKHNSPVAKVLETLGFNPATVISFLNFLVFLDGYNHRKMHYVPSKIVKKHLGMGHAPIAAALEKAGFIKIKHSYSTPREGIKGFTKKYGITDYGISQIEAQLDEYLNYLFTAEAQRLIKKSRLNCKDQYQDKILKNQRANMEAVTFDLDTVNEVLKGYKPRARVYAKRSLIEVLEKPFHKLERNETTGRIYNPVSGLPKPLKRLLSVKGAPFICEIDARCCHPSLFGQYVATLEAGNQRLQDEAARYTRFFEAKSHPRKLLAKQFGYSDEKMKSVMNKYINGGTPWGWEKYDLWLRLNYPEIYRVWKLSNIKETGPKISKYFESLVFRDETVVAKAAELGLMILDNHDALLVYSDEGQGVTAYSDFLMGLGRDRLKTNLKMSCDFPKDEPKEEDSDLALPY